MNKEEKKESMLVFAGNYRQFTDYISGKDDKKYKYVNERTDFLGLREFNILKVGTWYERDKNFELLTEAENLRLRNNLSK